MGGLQEGVATGTAERVIGVGMDPTELGIGLRRTAHQGDDIPPSAIRHDVEDHPWPRMAAAGLHLTLNSDDPAFIGSDLGAEYAALARAFGYDLDAMTRIVLAGIDAAWLSEPEKAALRERTEAATLRLGTRMASHPESGTP